MASPSADFLLRRPSGSNNERLAAARRAKIDHFDYAHTKSALSHVGGTACLPTRPCLASTTPVLCSTDRPAGLPQAAQGWPSRLRAV